MQLEGNPAAGCLITSLVNHDIRGTKIATRAARRKKCAPSSSAWVPRAQSLVSRLLA